MKIARYIDHAVLNPAMTPEEVRAAIQLGIDNDVYSVCVQPRDIETALAMCKGTNTLRLLCAGLSPWLRRRGGQARGGPRSTPKWACRRSTW